MINKKKILIGSSDPEFAFGIKSQLEGMKAFSPVVVTGARELIEVEQMFYFSAVLVDAFLDDFPGFEVCRKLREAGRDTPIILFSLAPEQECARLRNSWQADRCLVKSVPVPDLFDRIREVMEAKAKSPGRMAQAAEAAEASRKEETPKEEKFDRLDEIGREEVLIDIFKEIMPDAEFEIGKTSEVEKPAPAALETLPDVPVIPPPDSEPRTEEAPAEPKPLEEDVSRRLDELDDSERPRISSTPEEPEEAPAGPKPLEEDISSRLDELDDTERPKLAPLPMEPGPEEAPAGPKPLEEDIAKKLEEAEEEKRPEPAPASSGETIPIETSSVAREQEEPGRKVEIPGAVEFVPSEPGEEIPLPKIKIGLPSVPSITVEKEAAIPERYGAGEGEAGLVPWGSAFKIFAVLAGLGLGLGYFLAR